ncbi:MAG: hypothetical protein JJ896_13490 [Rhodothermales bacterium]|nr:hypothetical protein [Rhodothermales bacterium]MBO6780661.1 hypothetical protein [Rhodothermales bacterium]
MHAFLIVALVALANPAPDAQDLVGTWQVDLRPTPDSGPYYQPFVVRAVEGDVINGTFYGSAVQLSQVNTSWGDVQIAFVTTDGSAQRYVTMARLGDDGVLRGSTYSPDRDLLQPWTAEREDK